MLCFVWLKHGIRSRLRRREGGGPARREHIYVDASFTTGEGGGERGACGVGVWLPRRRIALALKLEAATSMEAETLALLAGALAARRFGIARPVIFSDCKSAVGTAKRLLAVSRAKGLGRQLTRLTLLSGSHAAYRQIYDVLQALDGSLEWRPREDNREADIASCIGSRIGHMGIRLDGRKDRAHSLNDVLSLAENGGGEVADDGLVRQRLRCGTSTVGLATCRVTSAAAFMRQARRLIGRLSAEVA